MFSLSRILFKKDLSSSSDLTSSQSLWISTSKLSSIILTDSSSVNVSSKFIVLGSVLLKFASTN
jgi:hypothetical protein